MSTTIAGTPAALPPERLARPAPAPRPTKILGWTAAVAIVVSVALIIAVCASGPSVIVPDLQRTWPPPPLSFPWHPSVLAAAGAVYVAVILGTAGVACGLAAVRRGGRPPMRALLAGAAIAVATLTVLPPAGSTDSISYATYGRIAEIGQSPYRMTPLQLLDSGDPVGRQTTRNWETDPSLYGPLATAAQWTAAELGGLSVGRIIFWLKLQFALAFLAVAVLLDRLLRADPAARARAHLLWSVNPLMLWAVLAGAHIDGLAAGLGFLGLILVRPRAAARSGPAQADTASTGQPSPPGAPGAPAAGETPGTGWVPAGMPDIGRALAAGMLVGAAAAIKSPYTLLGLGLFWAFRRSPKALAAAAAGAGLILVPGYLAAGGAAISDLASRSSNLVPFDSFWRLFFPPFGFGSEPAGLPEFAVAACLAIGWLLARRLPPGPPGLPAIRPALVATTAWIFVWPLQRAWYDVMVYCLIAVLPASRLDWLLLARSVPTTLDLVTGGGTRQFTPSWWHTIVHDTATGIAPVARLVAVAVLVLLCVSGAWGPRASDGRRHRQPGGSARLPVPLLLSGRRS